jgi:adenosyl cobinamide kinase/adenosyl cobinamide phosphate guanylyltransferase
MKHRAWRHALVLGGTRSGKSELAERLVMDAPAVRYVATGWRGTEDAEWERRIDAHRARRPAGWATVEVGPRPEGLPALLRQADPAEVILVDELGTWVSALLAEGSDVLAAASELGEAVAACRARLVLVSPEVGLAPVALTPAGRVFVDAVGATNISVAAACDAVVLVVAGQPLPVKGVI